MWNKFKKNTLMQGMILFIIITLALCGISSYFKVQYHMSNIVVALIFAVPGVMLKLLSVLVAYTKKNKENVFEEACSTFSYVLLVNAWLALIDAI